MIKFLKLGTTIIAESNLIQAPNPPILPLNVSFSSIRAPGCSTPAHRCLRNLNMEKDKSGENIRLLARVQHERAGELLVNENTLNPWGTQGDRTSLGMFVK